MATIYPGDRSAREVAATLLGLIPDGRRHEVEYYPAPPRFVVPEDIAREYERTIASPPVPPAPPARGVRRGRGEAADVGGTGTRKSRANAGKETSR